MHEIAKKNLESGDKIEKTYTGKLDGLGGYIILSDRKLMFVHEEGFLRKNYELTLDLFYDKISKISQEGKYELNFTDVKGKKYVFKSEMPIKNIIESLEKFARISQ